jgi:acyl-CoA dehydrogenase
MDDLARLLDDTAERLLSEHCTMAVQDAAERGEWPEALWDALQAAGLTTATLPESLGGAGLGLDAAFGILRNAARHGAPVPLAETLGACWLAGVAGLQPGDGPLTIAPVRPDEGCALRREGEGWRLSGRVTRIPWGRHAARILVLATDTQGRAWAALLPRELAEAMPAQNLALEPRDMLVFDGLLPAASVAPWPMAPDVPRLLGAALRSAQIAGALERALELTVGYAQQRVQFGRPIAKFQAIQHALAQLAEQAAVASAAAELAAAGFAGAAPDALPVAAAKGRASEAASAGAALAHQAHGAIGFTWDYPLHVVTRRLWSWRDEFGNEAEWYPRVADPVLAAGADGIWPVLSRSLA